jgi:hypothetical protein
MARRPKRDGTASWIANIAARSGADEATVEEVLDRRRIKASPAMTRPRRLTLKTIAFSGEKHGTLTEGAFDFAWGDLEPGLYAILSDGNLKGKSSILHVARWLLRGSPAEGLQPDVKAWIKKASLQFALNETTYEVRLDDPEQGIGALLQSVEKTWTEVARFASTAEFKSTMSTFFLRELGLDALPTWNDDLGKEVLQDWAALSGALSMGPTFGSLLGEVNMSGLPTRLMQMYLGLPWVSTYCAAHVAKSVLEREETERTRRHEEAQREQTTRLLQLEGHLGSARDDLAKLPALADYQTQYSAASAALLKAQGEQRVAREAVDTAKATLAQVEEVECADRRRVVEITDIIAAGRIFRALDPKCCPRCDALVTDARRKHEEAANACAMCGETMHADEDGKDALIAARETAAASKAAATAHRGFCRDAERRSTKADEEVARCNTGVAALESVLRAGDRRGELTLTVARLEARIEEIRRPVAPPSTTQVIEMAIVAEAVEECRARVKEKQEALLTDVSAQIVAYARRFGMPQLSEAKLKGNASLEIVKGGKSTTFSAVTVGEKLRLKIATVLAILKSGERRGIGRHPGLLFIDSPGAQELVDDNLEDLMRELKGVSKELQHLQVFVAAVASAPMLAHVDKDRVLRKQGEDWMW